MVACHEPGAMSLFTLQTADQQQYGPVELDTLKAWAREGRIERDNFIYDHTRLKWIEAVKVPQIMEFFQAAPAPAAAVPSPAQKQNAMGPAVPEPRHEKPAAFTVEAVKPAETVSDQLKSQSGGLKLKIQRELMRGEPSGDGARKESGLIKPPSVLERISRIFVAPFAKKTTGKTDETPKKQSQKLK